MRLIKFVCFLLALFYLFVNVSCYDRRPKLAMVYRNLDGDFKKAELFPHGHGNFSRIIKEFDEYKHENNRPGEKLYRTFKPNWKSWDLHLEYLIHPRWKLEYLPWVIEGEAEK